MAWYWRQPRGARRQIRSDRRWSDMSDNENHEHDRCHLQDLGYEGIHIPATSNSTYSFIQKRKTKYYTNCAHVSCEPLLSKGLNKSFRKVAYTFENLILCASQLACLEPHNFFISLMHSTVRPILSCCKASRR